jgi:hypothetical protein
LITEYNNYWALVDNFEGKFRFLVFEKKIWIRDCM